MDQGHMDDFADVGALGISDNAAALYLQLVSDEPPTLEQVDDDALAELMHKALAHQTPHAVEALSPLPYLAAVVDGAQARVEALRTMARQWEHLYSESRSSLPGFALARGNEATRALYDGVQQRAQHEIYAFDRGPHLQQEPGMSEPQPEQLDSGVTYRVVYDRGVLESPALLTTMREAVSQGEQARVVPHLPLRMIVADDREGILIYPVREGVLSTLHVTSPWALRIARETFEIFWDLGVPLTHAVEDEGDEPSPETTTLLMLLSAGLTDQAIAREMGISERTLARRSNALQERLAARGRFQLAVQAARRGWIS